MPVRLGITVVAALIAAVLGRASTAAAEPASAVDALRRHLDAVFATIQSPSFLEKDVPRRRAAVRGMSDRLFNWDEMSRRALGRHWDERTPAERRVFADRFARLAERAYLSQAERVRAEHLIREPVRYLGETVDGHETIAHTQLAYLRDLPADFRMRQRTGRWEVCDVGFGGVSVVENYRAQFDRLLARGSYPALVDRMASMTADSEDTRVAP